MPEIQQSAPTTIHTGSRLESEPQPQAAPSSMQGQSNPEQATDVYSTPIPQGATLGSDSGQQGQGDDEYSTPIPQGATNGQSDEIQINDNDSTLMKGVKGVGGVAEGLGEGVFKTLAGATDLVGGKDTGVSNELHKLAGDNNVKHGTPQNIGQAMESIGEFLMGDEALKSLSMADRLTQVSKVMKLIEKSPRLAQTLRLGINVGKAGAELGPEERAALQKSPILARLAGAGMDALRQGLVQFEQTGLKGGNDAEALKSGGTMAAISGGLGGTLGVAGGILAKGAEGAENAAALSDAAKAAPTSTEASEKFGQTVNDAVQPEVEHAQGVQEAAQGQLDQAGEDVGKLAANAPQQEAISASAQKAAQKAHDALGQEFEKGRNQLIKLGGDTAVTYEGSPLQQVAKELTEQGASEAHPLDEAFSQSRPGSKKANDMLDKLLDPYGEKELQDTVEKGTTTQKATSGVLDASGKPVAGGETTKLSQAAQDAQDELDAIKQKKADQPIQLTVEDLLDRRKLLNERLRNTGWMSDEQRADRQVYRRLITGIDDTLQQLMTKTGNPEAPNILKDMNTAYKTGISRFDNPDVDALLQGKTNDVAKRLMGGSTSVADINTVKDAIGKDAFQKLSDDSLSRMVADSVDNKTGEFSFKNFFNKWNRIPAPVRDAMFKNALGRDIIDKAVSNTQRLNASEVLPETDKVIKDATATMKNLLGNGDINSLLKDPTRIQNLSQLVGPDGMSELGHTILQNQLREAATSASGKVGNVDTGKFLKFIESLKDSPEVVNSLFKPTPESAKAYEELLAKVDNVHGVKNAVKFGILTPSLAAVPAGVVAAGHATIPAIIGSLATAGTEGAFVAKGLLEKIANSPAVWKSLSAASKAASSQAAEGAGIVSKVAAGKTANKVRNIIHQRNENARRAYADVKDTLSQ